MRGVVAVAILALVAGIQPAVETHAREAAAEPAAGANDSIDRVIGQRMGEAGIAGLGAAIIIDRKVAWMKGYGYADKARARLFTPDTVMNIASISKTFTGAALMRAVQEGKLSLDEDVNAYLPFKVVNPHHPDARITLRQLATHTSGITDRWEAYEKAYRYDDAPEPLDGFLKRYLLPGGADYSKDNFVDFPPGTHREYSNIGAALAGYIVELAVGETLAAYTRRHIFQPLRMNDTAWSLAEVAPGKHSKLYVSQDGDTFPIQHYDLTTYPDGGVRTSVSDLSKFFIALLNDGEYDGARILTKESAAEMLRFQYTESNKPDNVNLSGEDSVNSGIFWGTRFDVTRIGHNGSDPGVRTAMLSDLDREIGVVLFSNTSLSGEGMRHYFAIFQDLWKHAEALRGSPLATGAAESQPGSGERFKDCPECPEMVVVPAGEFVMGSPPGEPEREGDREDQVRVTIAKPFAIGAYAVTRGEFAAFVAATGYEVDEGCWFWTGTTWVERADRSWRAPGFEQDDRHPVTCVDLKTARAYVAWLSEKTGKRYRLPSETEREYATRAGTTTPYWWGDTISTDQANYDGRTGYSGGPTGTWRQATVAVDSFEPNPWGLYNVHGNVWDWTEDCWNERNAGNAGDGSARTTGDCTWHVARGGAWNYSPTYVRSAYRYWNEPQNRSGVQGMRVVTAQ